MGIYRGTRMGMYRRIRTEMCKGMGMRIDTLYNGIAWFNSKYSVNITITQRVRTVTVVNI